MACDVLVAVSWNQPAFTHEICAIREHDDQQSTETRDSTLEGDEHEEYDFSDF
jgi:hypothetical protein